MRERTGERTRKGKKNKRAAKERKWRPRKEKGIGATPPTMPKKRVVTA